MVTGSTYYHPTADKEMKVGTTYCWRVAARDPNGVDGAFSAQLSFNRQASSGPTPIAPMGTQGAPSAIGYPQAPAFSWSPLLGASTYTLQYGTDPNFTSGTYTSVTTANTKAVPSTLITPETLMFWRVRAALPSSVTTEWSLTQAFKTVWQEGQSAQWPSAPAAPILVAPADGTSSPWSEPRFRWNGVPGAAKYRITITLANDTVWESADVIGTSYVAAKSLKEDTYKWKVRALDSGGNAGPWSEQRDLARQWRDESGYRARPTVWFGLPSEASAPPASIAADEFIVSWTPTPRAAYYTVQVSALKSFVQPVSPTACQTVYSFKTVHTSLTANPSGTMYDGTALSGTTAPVDTIVNSLIACGTIYARVQAVDAPTTGAAANWPYSLWSDAVDAARGETGTDRDGLLAISDLTPAPLAGSAEDAASLPAKTLPAYEGATPTNFEDTPLLAWDRVAGADSYRLFLSVEEGFTTSELVGSDAANAGISVRTTRVLMPATMSDNAVGKPYFWSVIPCFDGLADPCPMSLSEVVSNTGTRTRPWVFGIQAARPDQLASTPIRDLSVRQAPAPIGTAEPDACELADGAQPSDAQSTQGESGLCLSWQDLWVVSNGVSGAAGDGWGPGIHKYRVEISTSETFATLAATIDSDATAVIPNIRLTDALYYWRVRAIDGNGAVGLPSTPASFRRPKPLAPTPLSTVAGKPIPTLSWSPVAGAASYAVETYSGSAITGTPISSMSVGQSVYSTFSSTSWQATNADGFAWRVRAIDALGEAGPWSDTATFSLGAATPVLDEPADGATQRASALGFTWRLSGDGYRTRLELANNEAFASARTYDVASFTTSVHEADVLAVVPTETLLAGTYYWRVSEITPTGGLLARSPSRQVTLTTPPATPTGLQVTTSRGKLTATWTAPSGATSQRLRYRKQGTSDWSEELNLSGTAPSATVNGLEDQVVYEVAVAALNGSGHGRWTSAALAAMPTLPTTPRTPVVTLGNRSATLKWTAPTGTGGLPLTSYLAAYKQITDSVWTTVEVAPTVLTRTFTGLVGGVTYQFRVIATNELGSSPALMFPDTLMVIPPVPPTGLHATPASGSLALAWTASSTSTGAAAAATYTVSYRQYTSGAWPTTWKQKTLLTTTSWTLTGLTNGNPVQVTVAGVMGSPNTGVVGDPSSVLTATPAGVPATAVVTAANSNGSIVVKWTAPSTNGSAITGYQVYYSRDNVTWTGLGSKQGSTVRSYIWGTPTLGVKYYFKVRTYNAIGTSDSASVYATAAKVPGKAVVTAANSNGSIVVKWTAPATNGSAITGYQVYYSKDNVTWTGLGSKQGSTVRSYTWGTPTLGVKYYFKVRTYNAIGTSDSASVYATAAKVPGPVVVTLTSSSGVLKVSWSKAAANGAAIAGYYVHISTSTTFSSTPTKTASGTATYVTYSVPKKGVTYYVKVRARNAIGYGPFSGVVSRKVS